MDTLGLHFGFIPKDLELGKVTEDDVTHYFYDRTGLNLSLFDLFRLL
jgi:hypothetical protein